VIREFEIEQQQEVGKKRI